jgi:FkbM family methyltransferase
MLGINTPRFFCRRMMMSRYGSGPNILSFNGVKIALDFAYPLHRTIYLRGGFEPELTHVLQRAVRPGDVFVDIGANFGWYTNWLLVKEPGLRVAYAFEPVAATFRLLERSLRANQCERRCVARRLAIGAESSTLTIKKFAGLDLMHASLYPLADVPFEEEEVGVKPLDMLVQEMVSVPTVIKCDVEGAERDVLLGSANLMAGAFGPPPLWFLEANYETAAMAGYFPWELAEIAAKHGYKCYTIREFRVTELRSNKGLRHGDVLILGIPASHQDRLASKTIPEMAGVPR